MSWTKTVKRLAAGVLALLLTVTILPPVSLQADDFNAFAYANRYPDLQQAFGGELQQYIDHWNTNGQTEGRDGTAYPEEGEEDSRNHAFDFDTISLVSGGVDYSPVFDPDRYLAYYPDLVNNIGYSHSGAFQHFLNIGMKEGRSGNGSFNVYAYANRYKDLQKAFRGDLLAYYRHYCTNGVKEGRDATGSDSSLNFPIYSTVSNGIDYAPVFDAKYYLSAYPDLRAAFGSDEARAFQHFVTTGMKEGRSGNDRFNVYAYANRYKDLQNAFLGDREAYYRHYCTNGVREGRDATGSDSSFNFRTWRTVWNGIDYEPVFDANYYLNTYSDLKAAFGWDPVRAFNHFVTAGMREGRSGREGFNVYAYANRYKDLQMAFRGDLMAYYRHYCTDGAREGRNTTGSDTYLNFSTADTRYQGFDYGRIFDAVYYLNTYSDLKRAFGNNQQAAFQHYINHGIYEGRRSAENFNLFTYINNYEDLRKAFGDNYLAYARHYCTNGYKEHRNARGNDTSLRYKLVNKKYAEMDNIAQGYSSPTGYLILVDKTHTRVGVYHGSKGNWTAIKRYNCDVGQSIMPTPNGLMRINYKLLFFDVGRTRQWYATNFQGNSYFFHSIKYLKGESSPRTIVDGTMNQHTSAGCIRLYLNDAKWIWDNMPVGTTVYIYGR